MQNWHQSNTPLLYFTATIPGQVVPNIALSSPGHIIAARRSSLWLHWNYTYGGDGANRKYKEQVVGYRSKMVPTFVTLAKRNQQFGTLAKKSSISGPFNGRIDVISENSTLVVHDLQFNDSAVNFSSTVWVLFSLNRIEWPLEPVVTVNVIGE